MPAVAPSVLTVVSTLPAPAYSSGQPRWCPNSWGASPGRASPRLQESLFERASLMPMTMVDFVLVVTLAKWTAISTEYRQHFWSLLPQPSRRRSKIFDHALTQFDSHPPMIPFAFALSAAVQSGIGSGHVSPYSARLTFPSR